MKVNNNQISLLEGNVVGIQGQPTFNYSKDHCWQYDIRLKNLAEDMQIAHIDKTEMDAMRVSDFEFRNVTDREEQRKLVQFIKRHEWLGTISQFTTHWFGAYYNNVLAGAILMNLPNAFSGLLGENTPDLERLISRGACISWSPKNLASSLLMWSINWMVKNTQYRLFTAYSDPLAKELGTIYQACNFYYLGQKFGSNKRYINPYTGKLVSDRFFRQKTAYKKFAEELGIEWENNWSRKTGINWSNIPNDTQKMLKKYSKLKQENSVFISVPSKHKYAYVKGKNKKETQELRKVFLDNNNTFDYPKER